jgi:Peptidase family C25
MVDKLLIGNDTALTAKYGNAGLQAIQAAVSKLIAADQGRGLQTIYVAVDDQATMQVVSGTPVTNPGDPQQNKDAVDALFSFYTPQYVVLLGAVDVIPHQDLQNPAYNPARPNDDPDQVVPSDLPYACAAPYSQNAADFIAPARVLSRLPDVTGATSPAYLLHILDVATSATALTQADYANYLGVSAAVWNQSTTLSLTAIFGSGTNLQSVPPSGFQWPANLLGLRSHFFNCHGASNTPQYFGQTGQQYPVAHDAAYITGKLTPGTVAAAECCYGAELYDPSVASGQMGIANVYMSGGAYGFWGSTTIAYGPATSNANADLICQYFLKQILNGASLGRAALTARLKFANNNTAISPVDLKTLAQFILLGDASLQCVPLADAGTDVATKYAFAGVSSRASQRLSRIDRRYGLAGEAAAVEATTATPERLQEMRPDVQQKLEAVRAASGLQNPGILSFRVTEKAATKNFLAVAPVTAVEGPTAFHLLIERTQTEGEKRVINVRIVEVTEANGEFVRVRELFSR